MKFLLGFIVGVAASFAAYQLDTKREIPTAEEASQEASEAKTDFTFYENLFDTSVTVLDGVYDQALSNEESVEGGAGPLFTSCNWDHSRGRRVQTFLGRRSLWKGT